MPTSVNLAGRGQSRKNCGDRGGNHDELAEVMAHALDTSGVSRPGYNINVFSGAAVLGGQKSPCHTPLPDKTPCFFLLLYAPQRARALSWVYRRKP